MARKSINETLSIIPRIVLGSSLLLFSTLSLISLIAFYTDEKPLGLFGVAVGWFLTYLTGYPSLLIPLFSGWLSLQILKGELFSQLKFKLLFFGLLLLSICLYCVILDLDGGTPLLYLYQGPFPFNLHSLLGKMGSSLFTTSLFLLSSFFLFPIDYPLLWGKVKTIFQPSPKIERRPIKVRKPPIEQKTFTPPPPKKSEPPLTPTPNRFSTGTLPPPSLLTPAKKGDSSQSENLQELAKVLEETLLSFGLEGRVGNIVSGPTVTSFEVHPAVGVKVQKIKALENDLALNMEAKSIRIVAPIPGKACVGVEVPNSAPQEVGFRELQENYLNQKKRLEIPLLLGKNVSGEDLFADLAKTPHLLIAGATGSGKSVAINTMVMSILMNAHPEEIKLMMVDPKKVELSGYSALPHMLTPVITEPKEAHAALLYLVKEMEKRYELFRRLGLRNILSYNQRKQDPEKEALLDMEVPPHLPYIVIIIDEFADLMMISNADMETPIARIAQMARAVGIHMILATQRPSREVITGLIKANFPSRISFKVSSRINSQIILDDTGAESLLGNGDMLFLPPGTSSLLRAQGAFIRDEDIQKVVNHVQNSTPTNYIIPSFAGFRGATEEGDREQEEFSDQLYEEAKATVLETGNASTTFLQRKLKIGYARAASLMDSLERAGIVGPQEGAKPRKIFYPNEDTFGDA